ncbi:uncharacterized protein LOC121592213 [Anopheles merus]|uniref:uncharacterized protein LOC121592213 n=1 Tax=Anopheles merus TaxID=30066 RepID=UPI001BE3F41F|nr:uncharacterized protein LOC121592213 [Anopheles merus]
MIGRKMRKMCRWKETEITSFLTTYTKRTKNLPRSTVHMILGLLRRKLKLCLPADARTLLKTSTKVGMEIQPILGGQFWYQGIETVIREHFEEIIPHVDLFYLQVFIDGLPLYKSSARQLWPILFKVEELPDAPVMLDGVFCGFTKPDHVEGFLRPLVEEVNKLQSSGLRFGDKTVGVKLHMFIADLPARCFAKAPVTEPYPQTMHPSVSDIVSQNLTPPEETPNEKKARLQRKRQALYRAKKRLPSAAPTLAAVQDDQQAVPSTLAGSSLSAASAILQQQQRRNTDDELLNEIAGR